MIKPDHLVLIKEIYQGSEAERLVPSLLSIIPSLQDKDINFILEKTRDVLFSNQYSSTQKLQSVRVLRSLMLTSHPYIISYLTHKIVPNLPDLLVFEDIGSGFDIWVYLIQIKDKSRFKINILLLQCIEIWANIYGNSFGSFNNLLQSLKSKNLEFPPSFFLQAFGPLDTKPMKKDLHRVRKLVKELLKSIRCKSKEKALIYKKIVCTYEKYLSYEIEYRKNNCLDATEDLLFTYNQVIEGKKIFDNWKNEGFKGDDMKRAEVCERIEDPVPKSVPFNENSRDSELERSQAGSPLSNTEELFLDDTFEESYFQINTLREKLMDSKDILGMYKEDLGRLQDNYLRVLEEKEILSLKVKALSISNQDLERALYQNKDFTDKILQDNTKIAQELECIKANNQQLIISVKEMQGVINTLEKNEQKNKDYIENIENANVLLLSCNEKLKSELEKCKNFEVPLISRSETEGLT
jgi:hypothetical protein